MYAFQSLISCDHVLLVILVHLSQEDQQSKIHKLFHLIIKTKILHFSHEGSAIILPTPSLNKYESIIFSLFNKLLVLGPTKLVTVTF